MKRRNIYNKIHKPRLQIRRKVTGRASLSPYAKINWDKATVLFKRPSTEAKSSEKSYPKTRDVLKILAAAGAVGMIFLLPPSIALIGAVGKIVFDGRRYDRWRTKHVIGRLARQKYVTVEEGADGSATVTITKAGMTHALSYELDYMQIQKPKKWDGRWRVVIFDILEKYRRTRDIFRMRLVQMGMYQLQESVYVSPYPCFDEVEFLRELYGIPQPVRYLLVEKIEDDTFLKDRFNLNI